MTESQALQRCQCGDPRAFRHLVDRYQDELYRTATLMTGSQTLAKAQVREALHAAWRGVRSVGLGAQIRPWLMHSLVRQEPTPPGGSSDPSDQSQHPVPDRISPPPRKPGSSDRKRQQIRRALGALDPAHRHLLILRYFANLTVPELSLVFSEFEHDVESRRREALSQLRRRLQEYGGPTHGRPEAFASDHELVDALRDYFGAATAAVRVPADLWDTLETRATETSCLTRVRRKLLAAASRCWTPLAATGGAAALASAVICAATA